MDAKEIYETLSIRNVQNAADEFRSVYEKTDGKDGYASLEVDPHLAYDTPGTIEEARRLWTGVNRPNIFIKVPAPRNSECLPQTWQTCSPSKKSYKKGLLGNVRIDRTGY